MRILVIAHVIIITCAFSSNAQVIDYEIDPTFDSGLLLNRGSVSDILLHDNGNLLITGTFNNWDSPAGTTCLLDVSGNLILSNGNAGTLFKLSHYLNDYIHFGNSGVQRFNLPLQIIPNYDYEWAKPAYSGPLPNKGLDAIVMPDDNILVAGRFFTDSTLMGTNIASQGLRQLCMIDSTGAPVEGFPMLRCEWPTNSQIYSIRELSTGEFIIAGSFDEVDGHYCPKLAKLNADFSVNTQFISPFSETGASVGIRIIDSQDRIWVSYDSDVIFSDFPDYPSKLARIMSNGELDTSYLAPAFLTYAGSDPENPTNPFNEGPIILEDTDGTFILGGSFIEVNGELYNRLIKINDAGEIIEGAFGGIGPDAATWGTWTPALGPIAGTFIRVLRKLPDGKLLIGGQFSSFGGEPYSCLVRLQPSGYVGAENIVAKNKLIIFPNPAKDSFTITIPDHNTEFVQVEIYDLMGRIILTSTVHHSYNIVHLENVLPGTYLVKASNSNGMYSGKLVVQ